MKHLYSVLLFILAGIVLLPVNSFSQQNVTDYSEYVHNPIIAGQQYGSSLAIDGDYLFVAGNGNNSGVKGVIDIWNLKTKQFVKTIPAPDDVIFWGYKIDVSDKYMAVIASMSQAFFLYSKGTDGLFKDTPIYKGTTIGKNTNVAINGSTLAIADGTNASIYEISVDNGVYSCDRVMLDNTAGNSYSAVSVKGDIVAFANNSKGLEIYKKVDGEWSKDASVHPVTTVSGPAFCSVCVGDDMIVFSNRKEKTVYVAKPTATGWDYTSFTNISATDFGNSVKIVGSNISVTTNNKQNKAYIYSYVNDSWTNSIIVSIPDGSNMGWASAFNGHYYAVSFQNAVLSGGQAGKVYLFDLKGVLTDIRPLISNKPVDNFYYDLQGRKVLNPRNGPYIYNGKLVIIQ